MSVENNFLKSPKPSRPGNQAPMNQPNSDCQKSKTLKIKVKPYLEFLSMTLDSKLKKTTTTHCLVK